jgi:hypothetical protein
MRVTTISIPDLSIEYLHRCNISASGSYNIRHPSKITRLVPASIGVVLAQQSWAKGSSTCRQWGSNQRRLDASTMLRRIPHLANSTSAYRLIANRFA